MGLICHYYGNLVEEVGTSHMSGVTGVLYNSLRCAQLQIYIFFALVHYYLHLCLQLNTVLQYGT